MNLSMGIGELVITRTLLVLFVVSVIPSCKPRSFATSPEVPEFSDAIISNKSHGSSIKSGPIPRNEREATLAPPPVNFTKAFVEIDGKIYMVTADLVERDGQMVTVLDMKTVSRTRKILEITEMFIAVHPPDSPRGPTDTQQAIQDEFGRMGCWPLVFIIFAFFYGIVEWWRGDMMGLIYSWGSIAVLFGLMWYGFNERWGKKK